MTTEPKLQFGRRGLLEAAGALAASPLLLGATAAAAETRELARRALWLENGRRPTPAGVKVSCWQERRRPGFAVALGALSGRTRSRR